MVTWPNPSLQVGVQGREARPTALHPNSWEGEGGGTKGPPSHNALRSPPEPTPGCLS